MDAPPVTSGFSEGRNDTQVVATIDEGVPSADRGVKLASYCQAFGILSFATIADALRLNKSASASFPYTRLADLDTSELHSDVESEIEELISKGHLPDHRIDVVEGRIVSVRAPAWDGTRAKALTAAAETEHSMRLRLWQVNVVLAGMEAKPEKRASRWW